METSTEIKDNYWSPDIIGGDRALDWICAFRKEMQPVEMLADESEIGLTAYPVEDLDVAVPDLQGLIEKATDEADKRIGYQVLAKLMLDSGCYIGPGFGNRLLMSFVNDEWALKSFDRAIIMKKYAYFIEERVLAGLDVESREHYQSLRSEAR